jgi:hypothetical protein
MKLSELSKLPSGSYLVTDPTKQRFYPLRWIDLIHVYFKDESGKSTHQAHRRSTAFVYGLCEGVAGQMPPVAGGSREGCGRKPLDPKEKKQPVTFWPTKKIINAFGGKDTFRKRVNNFINQKI